MPAETHEEVCSRTEDAASPTHGPKAKYMVVPGLGEIAMPHAAPTMPPVPDWEGGLKLQVKGQARLLIAGPPCVGKGTVSKIIAEKWGLCHLSTGDLLRGEIDRRSAIGEAVEGLLAEGKLVPQEIVLHLLKQKIQENPTQGYLIDGFPRTPEQAELLSQEGVGINGFLLLDCADSVLIDRVTMRRMDPVTKTVYNLRSYPPPTEEIAQRLICRADDTEAVIKRRIRDYRSTEEALMRRYRTFMISLDASLPAEHVANALLHKVEFI
eukprot:GHVU01202591.1.p1 GENE.GHVU01202591.1~~GHVU01202591.1.p1  ORF type:complete len:267 (-),score=24.54 GHVU01202591.1:1781-2581(-)